MSMSFLTGYLLGKRDASQTALRAASIPVAGHAETQDLYDIHDRIDRLVLAVSAMASLMEDARVATDEQLAARIREMDESDGTADGKRTVRPTTCGGCGAAVAAGLAACQFCGTPVTPAAERSPLEGV